MSQMNQGDASRFSRLLPAWRRCDAIPIDRDCVLLTAAGFEERTFAAAERAVPSDGVHAIVLRYLPEDERNRVVPLLSLLYDRGFRKTNIEVMDYDRYQPDGLVERLGEHLRSLGVHSVVLDVSTLSKLGILIVLDICREFGLSVRLFYAEAQEYGPKQSEYEEARRKELVRQPTIEVYTGIQGVVRVNRLSSVAMQGQPTAAIAFMSFNELLTQALVDAVYPSRLFLINGRRPARLAWREQATAWIHEQLRREWATDNPLAPVKTGVALPQRSVSTHDYRETVATLISLYWAFGVDHRILLAPTGSKMQTVGCYIAKAIHPDIHIEYPTPTGYLDLYSSGIDETWIIDLGALGRLVTRLTEFELELRYRRET